MNESCFSNATFASAWCDHFGGRLLPLSAGASGGRSVPVAVANVGRTGLWSVDFAPEGFYGSPGWRGELDSDSVAALLAQLQVRRIRKFVWNVRFDHGALASLIKQNVSDVSTHATQVLALGADVDETFAGFNATIRNQVRKARKSGVTVRLGSGAADLRSYYAIHERHVQRHGGFEFVYPEAFLGQLIQPESCGRLLLAMVDDRAVAGGIFLEDGNSVYYFHGAYDSKYSKQYPTCAVIDEAVRWAHGVGAVSFNMGGSAGIESLERFKSFWGTAKRETWRFTWRNPLWEKLDSATQWIRKLTHTS